jgi:methylated-DNA-[protein]-cysteine S-methyltransferase
MTRLWRQATPFGDAEVVVGDAGVVRLALPAPRAIASLDAHPERDHAVAGELDEYFAGTRRVFTVALDLSGVHGFGRRVLETLHREVPWGETVSYGELADMAGAPRAARAVGTVMARCPISVIVPCHRVVATGGRIGGYGNGGADIKRALLALEGVHLP